MSMLYDLPQSARAIAFLDYMLIIPVFSACVSVTSSFFSQSRNTTQGCQRFHQPKF